MNWPRAEEGTSVSRNVKVETLPKLIYNHLILKHEFTSEIILNICQVRNRVYIGANRG